MSAAAFLSTKDRMQPGFFNNTHPPVGVRRLIAVDSLSYSSHMNKHRQVPYSHSKSNRLGQITFAGCSLLASLQISADSTVA